MAKKRKVAVPARKRTAKGKGAPLEQLVDNIDTGVVPGEALTRLRDRQQMATAIAQDQYIIFTIGTTEYGVVIANVTEVGDVPGIAAMPNVPDWLVGVANLRGDILSLVHLGGFLNLTSPDQLEQCRMLVARSDQEKMVIGLLVDRVVGLRTFPRGQIKPPQVVLDEQVSPYLQGVYEYEGRLLPVLDFERLLLSTEMQQFR